MEAVVKWKFRTVKPGEKHHTIDGYISYVEKQVEERRNNSGVFAVNEKDVIGHNDIISPDNEDFQQTFARCAEMLYGNIANYMENAVDE